MKSTNWRNLLLFFDFFKTSLPGFLNKKYLDKALPPFQSGRWPFLFNCLKLNRIFKFWIKMWNLNFEPEFIILILNKNLELTFWTLILNFNFEVKLWIWKLNLRGGSTSTLSNFCESYGAASVAPMWFSIVLSLALSFELELWPGILNLHFEF